MVEKDVFMVQRLLEITLIRINSEDNDFPMVERRLQLPKVVQ